MPLSSVTGLEDPVGTGEPVTNCSVCRGQHEQAHVPKEQGRAEEDIGHGALVKHCCQ